MQVGINSYNGGMIKDIGYDSVPNSCYIDAVNIRITTTTGESGGSFTNIKGNKEAFTIPQDDATGLAEIIGYTTIRNKIIIYVADDSGTNGWIYEIMYNEATREILPSYPKLLYFNINLNFSKDWPIKAYGRYENDNIQRVYWTDYNNFFRSLNIADPNVLTFPLGQIDIFPDVEFTQPRLKVISGGGAVIGGSYQFAFRLITLDGKKTLISPPSNLIHVVVDSETLGQSAQYTGDLILGNTNKALTIEVDTTEYTEFDKIEFISIYHSDLNGIPEVKSVEEISIGGATTIEFIYTGTESSSTIELLDYISKSFPFKTPKTLTQKDNSLVVSNIKSSLVSLQELLEVGETFDAKTYRYNSSSVINNDVFNLDYNSDAHWDPDWHLNKQFKYQADGTTLGGEGINIKYNFYLEPFTIDAAGTPGFSNIGPFPDSPHNLNDGYTYYNTTFPNNTSPFISGLLRGYKRGESYRIGLVGETNKGEITFVEFIGDIKFPDISEEDGIVNNSGTNYFPLSDEITPGFTTAYSLGIQFTIDFSTAPSLLTKLKSYQIVRVKREEVDKRRTSQGIIKTFWFAPIASPGGGINFDLRVNSSTNVLHLMPRYPTTELNATFNTLEDQENAAAPFTPIYDDYLIKGQYLGFYSPDISYDKNNVRNLGSNINNTPCLLITGSYNSYSRTLFNTVDLTSENLPDLCDDYRLSCIKTFPVTYNSVENIKKWKNCTMMTMPDTSDYSLKVTSDYDGYYLRNYYAMDRYVDPTAHLNDPQGSAGGNSALPEFYKAATSIIGDIETITIDPVTGDPVVGGSTNWFDAPTNIQVIDLITGLVDPALHPSSTPIIDLIIPKSEVYGGYNTNALESNIFIACSPVIDITELNPVVYGGDTFLNVFTLQSSMLEFDPDFYEITLGNYQAYAHDNATTELYITESTVNLDLDYGSTLKRGVEYKLGAFQHTVLRQENSNTASANAKILSMYSYNDLYSKENVDVTYFIKPLNINSSLVNDIRSYLSEVKINGELRDSWTNFGINNYYDVDDYGPINEIVNWKDTVFFIQDRAVGVFAINREAIVTTTDNVPTKLGTGQGFGKHQYISKEHGSIHQYGVKTTDNGIYLFDAINRKLWLVTGNDAPLSEIEGIHSYINLLPNGVFLRKENGGDNSILDRGIRIGRDSINDELIFTFLGSGIVQAIRINTNYFIGDIIYLPTLSDYREITTDIVTSSDMEIAIDQVLDFSIIALRSKLTNTSIVYDELEQKFSCHASYTPSVYLENGDILLTPSSERDTIYTHNKGNFGEFYGVIQESYLTLIINHNSDLNKILRFIEFNSIVRNDFKIIDRTKTITAFRVQNEFQDTGKVLFSLVPSRFIRRFDKWRLKIPRDSSDHISRIRSTRFRLTLYFDNTLNKELIMNKIISNYDIQIF